MGALSAGSRRGPLPRPLRPLVATTVAVVLCATALTERLAPAVDVSSSIAGPVWLLGALAVGGLGSVAGAARAGGLALLHVRGAGTARRLWWLAADLLLWSVVGVALGVVAGLGSAVPLADTLDVALDDAPAAVGAGGVVRIVLVGVGLLACLLVGAWAGGRERAADEVTGRAVAARSSYLVTVLRLAVWPAVALIVFHASTDADDTPAWEAWLAPVVLGLAAAELVLLLAGPAGRALRRLVDPDDLDRWLITRMLGRGRELAAVTPILVAATVLATVALSTLLSAEGHLDASARVEVGAAERYPFDGGVVAALALAESIDPTGQYVAAGGVRQPAPAPDDPGGVLYVDASRASRVLELDDTSAAEVPPLLRGLGNRARSTQADQLVVRAFLRPGARVTVAVDYVTDADALGRAEVTLPPGEGAATRARVTVDGCESRCVILGAEVRTSASEGSVPVGEISSLRFGGLDIARSVDWTGSQRAQDAGFAADENGWILPSPPTRVDVAPGGWTDPLPVITAHDDYLATVPTLAAVEARIGSAERVAALPVLGTDGVLLDLGSALVDGGAVPDVDVFLWGSADAPAAVRDRLTDELGAPLTVADARRELGGGAVRLFAVLAGLTLLVAAAAAVGARPRLSQRARHHDDALRSAGVEPDLLRRVHSRLGWSRALLVGLATVGGSWATATLLDGALPVVLATRWSGPVDGSTPWLLLLGAGAAGAVLWWALTTPRGGGRRGGSSGRGSGLASIVRRGVRHRWLLSTGVILLLTLAVGSAVLGPVFSDATVRSYLATRLDDQSARQTGLEWTVTPDGTATAATAAASFGPSLHSAIEGPWEAPDITLTGAVGAVRPLPDAGPTEPLPRYRLLSRAGACDHLEVDGSCPRRPGDVLVQESDLAELGVSVGDSLRTRSGPLRIVGSYRPPPPEDDSFWIRPEEFAFTPATQSFGYGRNPAVTAAFITDPATFDELRRVEWTLLATSALDTGDDPSVGTLDRAVDSAARLADAPPTLTGGSIALESAGANLEDIRDDLVEQEDAASTAIAPAVISLILVALALLLRLLTAAADQRRSELALASLRGSARPTLWRLALAEPLLLIAVATPVGIAAGVGLSLALGRAWLSEGTALQVGVTPLAAALAVALAAIGVAILATRQSLRASLADQLSGVTRPVRQRRGAALGLAILIVAIAALVAARLGTADNDPQPTDLLIPMAIAVLCGLVLSWAITLAARAVIRTRMVDRALAGFLLTRSVGRRRENTLLVLPLVTALGICGLAIGVYGTAGQWWSSVATSRAPADQVWTAADNPQSTFDLTQRIDPDGDWTMAATQLRSPASPGAEAFDATLIDSTRLGTVGRWWEQWTPGTDADGVRDALGALEPPPLTAGEIGAEVDNRTGTDVYLYVHYFGPGGKMSAVDIGPFRDGRTETRVSRVDACRQGCRLVDIQIGAKTGFAAPMSGDIRVTPQLDGRTWETVAPAQFTTPAQGSGESPVQSSAADGATLVATIDTGSGEGLAEFSFVDDSEVVRVVVGEDADGVLQPGPDGNDLVQLQVSSLVVDPVLESRGIPFGGPRDLLGDIRQFRDQIPQNEALVTTWILVRDGAPDSVISALRDAGAEPSTTFDAELRAQESSAFALALRLYLVVAGLVLVMALAAVAITTAVQLPERRRDAAALRVVGVRRKVITRAILAEEAILLGLSVAVGVGSGALSAVLLIGTLRLGPGGDPDLPDVVPALDGVGLVLLGGAVFAGLFVIGALAAIRTVRAARGATLRESAR